MIACYLPFKNIDKKVDVHIMKNKVSELVKNREFKEEDTKFIRRQYRLSKSDYQDMICFGPPSAMEVNELTVVKVVDDKQKNHIYEQLQKRLDQQLENFQGYAPRQADLLKRGLLYKKGDYVILIVHEDAQQLKQKINALF